MTYTTMMCECGEAMRRVPYFSLFCEKWHRVSGRGFSQAELAIGRDHSRGANDLCLLKPYGFAAGFSSVFAGAFAAGFIFQNSGFALTHSSGA